MAVTTRGTGAGKLRLIGFRFGEPFRNMALDEAVARCVGAGESPPTLRLYGWTPSAVSVGYFQEVAEEVDLEFCRRRGVEVVRRLTGGGAVIHTSGELTYSFTAKEGDPSIPPDIQESYEVICTPIVEAVKSLGAEARFRPVNDIEVGGRKVSGSAQTRRFGAVLQHGTLLLDLDPSYLATLRIRAEKLKDKGVKDVGGRVTTLKALLGRRVDHQEAAGAVIRGFASFWGLETGEFSERELELAEELTGKYRSPEWLFRR